MVFATRLVVLSVFWFCAEAEENLSLLQHNAKLKRHQQDQTCDECLQGCDTEWNATVVAYVTKNCKGLMASKRKYDRCAKRARTSGEVNKLGCIKECEDKEICPTSLLQGSSELQTRNTMWVPKSAQDDGPLDLIFTNIIHNNLGGAGPDTGTEGIRYGNVVNYGGANVDLIVNAVTPYTSIDTEKNGLNGQMGTINLLNDNTVDLEFKFIDSMTSQPVTMGEFYFTIFDLDQGRRNMGRESISISGYSSAYTTRTNILTTESAANGGTLYRSTRWGTGETNPSDPYLLTEEQAAQAVAFTFGNGLSSFRLTYAVTLSDQPEDEPQGRNFLFAGKSAMYVCQGNPVEMKFGLSEVVYSNLGNQGPDTGYPEGLRFRNVAKVGNIDVDLLVNALTRYKPFSTERNGLNGEFGQINLNKKGQVDLTFRLLDPATDSPVTVDSLYFSIYDYDEGKRNKLREYSIIDGFTTAFMTDNTEITKKDMGGGKWSFESSTQGHGWDNPTDPMALTPRQKNRAVAFMFSNANSFNLTFKTGGGPKGGRNFCFAGKSQSVFC